MSQPANSRTPPQLNRQALSDNERKTAPKKRATATKKKISPQPSVESADEVLGARSTSGDDEKMPKADRAILSRHAPASAMSALAENAPVLIWVNSPTVCEFVNREFLEFLGVDEAEALGDSWVKFVHPEDRERYVSIYNEAVSRRGRVDVEFRFLRRDSEYRWMHSVVTPRFEGSVFKGYVGVSYDVHERKLAEAAVAQMAAIVESSDDAIISKDLNGIIVSWNEGAERVFGYAAAEVIGKSVLILIPEGRGDEEPFIQRRDLINSCYQYICVY